MRKFGKIALGTAAVFVGGIWALQAIGNNVESQFAEMDAQEQAAAAVATETVAAEPPMTTPAVPAAIQAPSSKPRPVKTADLDNADRAIAATINLNGYLCAKPIEVRYAATDLYGVRCITNRNGTGISDYLVNSRTGEVSVI